MGACMDPPNRAIVTELVTRGSLWEVLRTPNLFNTTNTNSNADMSHRLSCSAEEDAPADGGFFWPRWAVRRVLDDTCRGLAYLHSFNPPIIHRGRCEREHASIALTLPTSNASSSPSPSSPSSSLPSSSSSPHSVLLAVVFSRCLELCYSVSSPFSPRNRAPPHLSLTSNRSLLSLHRRFEECQSVA